MTKNSLHKENTHENLIVCMHGITSDGFDFRTTMEGWAKAGIRAIEPDLVKAREFENKNGRGSARQLIDDLGLAPYSSTNQLFLEEDGKRQEQAIEDLKWKVELAESLGADRLVTPSATDQIHGVDYYKQVYEKLSKAAEIAKPHNITLMLEFTRISNLINNVKTSLNIVRTIDHPNLAFMIDLYHFWAGPSKFEDLELIRRGEIFHVHFQDTPAEPPIEVAAMKDRAFPGEGVAPLQKILNKLVDLGYQRALSLELFDPTIRSTDPFQIGKKALKTITPYIKQSQN